MEWMNLHIPSVIRSPAYIGSSPAERGTWLSVLAYACEIESSGRIVGAAKWKDRQWQQSCGVMLREVKASDRLLRIDGSDVIVNGYPVTREGQVKRARGIAKAGAMARWGHDSDADAHADIDAEIPKVGIDVGNAEEEEEEEGEGEASCLEAVAAAGGYLCFKGEDQRDAWRQAIEGMSPEQITAAFAHRLPDGRRIRLPSGFTAARLRAEQAAKAAAKEASKARRQAKEEEAAKAVALEAESKAREATQRILEETGRVIAALQQRPELMNYLDTKGQSCVEAIRAAHLVGTADFLNLRRVLDSIPGLVEHIARDGAA